MPLEGVLVILLQQLQDHVEVVQVVLRPASGQRQAEQQQFSVPDADQVVGLDLLPVLCFQEHQKDVVQLPHQRRVRAVLLHDLQHDLLLIPKRHLREFFEERCEVVIGIAKPCDGSDGRLGAPVALHHRETALHGAGARMVAELLHLPCDAAVGHHPAADPAQPLEERPSPFRFGLCPNVVLHVSQDRVDSPGHRSAVRPP
mmetsp:Transcript_37365/g.106741  ORF Transcript_37365/g.106741 Transcript_37365/m.106741 type:complete len:201 (-) Transcript_37365:563-1165(-)